MKHQPSYFRLGLFILIGLALLVAGVVTLGVGAMFTQTVPVQTITLESVEGLDPGAPVKFRGVTIGKVASISALLMEMERTNVLERLKAGNQILITLALNREVFRTSDLREVRKHVDIAAEAGLRARISSSGIAGPSYVEILFLDPQQYPPPPVAAIPTLPYIPSAPGQLSKVAEDLSAVAHSLKSADLQKVFEHVDQLILTATNTVGEVRMKELRQQLGAMAEEASASARRLHEIVANPQIDEVVAGVNRTVNSEEIRAMIADLPKITARARTAMERLDEIARNPQLQKTLDGLSQTSQTASASMSELRRTLRSLGELLSAQQHELQQVIVSLRRVLENTASLTEDAKQNPARVLFGEPPSHVKPGEQP